MADRFEFLSEGWFSALREAVEHCFAGAREGDRGDVVALTETYTGVPAHLATGGTRAFTVGVRGGKAFVALERDEAARVRITGDYAAILPVARYDTKGETSRQAEMGAMFAKLVAGGSVRVEGDMATAPAWTAGVHDLVARQTA